MEEIADKSCQNLDGAPRPRSKNQERGLAAFLHVFCRPLPLKILRSQSDWGMHLHDSQLTSMIAVRYVLP